MTIPTITGVALDRVRDRADELREAAEVVRESERLLRREIVTARNRGCTVEEIAQVLGKSRPWVYHFMGNGQ